MPEGPGTEGRKVGHRDHGFRRAGSRGGHTEGADLRSAVATQESPSKARAARLCHSVPSGLFHSVL